MRRHLHRGLGGRDVEEGVAFDLRSGRRVGGRSELLRLEEQMESQIKKKCADATGEPPGPPVTAAVWFALRGWQPLCSPRLLSPLVGGLLRVKVRTPIHLGSPRNQGDKPNCLHGVRPMSLSLLVPELTTPLRSPGTTAPGQGVPRLPNPW